MKKKHEKNQNNVKPVINFIRGESNATTILIVRQSIEDRNFGQVDQDKLLVDPSLLIY